MLSRSARRHEVGQGPETSQPKASEERAPPWVSHARTAASPNGAAVALLILIVILILIFLPLLQMIMITITSKIRTLPVASQAVTLASPDLMDRDAAPRRI